MARFLFRFQKVLEHRGRLLDNQQRTLAELRRKRLDANRRRRELEQQAENNMERVRRLRSEGQVSSAQLYLDYLPTIQQQAKKVDIELASLDNEIRRAVEKLKALFKEKRSLEFLRDRDYLRFQEAERKEEEDLLNEINTMKYASRMRDEGRL
ncbi:flagellar export protein FliJ [Desulfurispira natronophila]|uniref:Flagellar export protein FliJ n=1 Tax=Desulfurispira natronophila TaxID=682562 RepID=A0A7W8DHE1_9BACT|nr:flagellar FliJ family protein [Desulfurispira natronophila]MBB5022395.1 flagellar export protein FliJ [Desulfurispira natronophila]